MSGLLPEDGVLKALAALQRFRVLCDTMVIRDVRGIATAAVRDAANGAEFLNRAERVLDCKIELLSGQREARFSGSRRHKLDLQDEWPCRGFGRWLTRAH